MLTKSGAWCDVCGLIIWQESLIHFFKMNVIPDQMLCCDDRCKYLIEQMIGKDMRKAESIEHLPTGPIKAAIEKELTKS